VGGGGGGGGGGGLGGSAATLKLKLCDYPFNRAKKRKARDRGKYTGV